MQARRPPEYVATNDLARLDDTQPGIRVDSGVPAAITADAAHSIGSTIADVMSGSAAHGAASSQPSARALEAALLFAAAGPQLKPDAPAP